MTQPSLPVRRLGLAVMACAAVAACGSTVQVQGSYTTSGQGVGASTDGAGTGGSAPLGTTGVGTGNSTGSDAGSTSSSGTTLPPGTGGTGTTGASGSAATSGSVSGTGGSAPSVATATSGHGYDAKTVWIGVITQKDTQTTFSKLGAANFDTGDTEKQATAIAADINAHGGILGRQVKLRFHDVDIVAAQTNNGTTAQAVCTDFVQDNPVVAVWNASTQLDQASTLRTCLAKAGVMLWTAAARGIGDNLMKQMAPYYFHTVMVSWDPLATTLVTRLKAQGWFSGWNTTLARPGTAKAKVGILVDGTPQGAHTATALKNALTQAGYPGSLSYSYTDPGQGQNSSAYYFKANGVTNVIVTDVELTAFQTSASQNAYYPRYGITTYNDPYANLEQSGATPANSMNGALGVGWAPNLDVSDQNSPPVSTAEKHCLAVVAKQESYSSSQRLAKAFASSLCDTLYLIARGATQSRSLTGPGIAAGVFATAKSYQPANGFAPALTATSPYVQGSVRDLQWDSSCSCLKYGRTVTALRT